jgi:hypothetical protein
MAKIGRPVFPDRFDIEGEELGCKMREFNIG